MANKTEHTDEAREVRILTEIYTYAKLDPSFIEELREILTESNPMVRLAEICE